MSSPSSKPQCEGLSVGLTWFTHRTILPPFHKIKARKSSYHLGNSLQLSFVLSSGSSETHLTSHNVHMLILLFLKSFIVSAVLSASVGQVRAHALRMMVRLENRLSGLQSRLIWSLWHLQMELQCLESLPIQLMVPYGRAASFSDSNLTLLCFYYFLLACIEKYTCNTLSDFSDTFMVEDAVEAIGFGTFQWKLSILTGLSWVRTISNYPPYMFCVHSNPQTLSISGFSVFLDGWCYGDDDPQHLSPTAALWVEIAQPWGGTAYIGNALLMCILPLVAVSGCPKSYWLSCEGLFWNQGLYFT